MNKQQTLETYIMNNKLADYTQLRIVGENKTHEQYIQALIRLADYTEELDDESGIQDEPDTTIMGSYPVTKTSDERVEYLRTEFIKRGHETEESLRRFDKHQKHIRLNRELMEELARYFDQQTALGLPIREQSLIQGTYDTHIMLL
jgi:hypothetical protein